jgi:hypothetical protein
MLARCTLVYAYRVKSERLPACLPDRGRWARRNLRLGDHARRVFTPGGWARLVLCLRTTTRTRTRGALASDGGAHTPRIPLDEPVPCVQLVVRRTRRAPTHPAVHRHRAPPDVSALPITPPPRLHLRRAAAPSPPASPTSAQALHPGVTTALAAHFSNGSESDDSAHVASKSCLQSPAAGESDASSSSSSSSSTPKDKLTSVCEVCGLGLPSQLKLCASCWLSTCQTTLLLGRLAKKRTRQDEKRECEEGEGEIDAPSDSPALVEAEMPPRVDLSCVPTSNKRKHQSQRCGVCGQPGHKSRTCAFKKGAAADAPAPHIASAPGLPSD